MIEVNPLKLIKSIKCRPALYTKNDPMYSHRKHKDRLWREVCMEVHPRWNELKPVERVEGGELTDLFTLTMSRDLNKLFTASGF